MNAEEFRAWLEDHEACEDALQWLDTLPDPSLQAVWDACPRGDWLLWLHEQAWTDFEVLAPVVYKAVNRALANAALALDKAGVKHKLEGAVVEDCASAQAAEDAARAAARATRAAEAVRAAEAADQVVVAAGLAAGVIGSAKAAAGAAAWSAWVAYESAAEAATGAVDAAGAATKVAWEAELRMCADDCRKLLPLPTMETGE